MEMPVSGNVLFQVIGEQTIQIRLLNQQLERLNDRIAKMEEKAKKDSKGGKA